MKTIVNKLVLLALLLLLDSTVHAQTWYKDGDGDGFGTPDTTITNSTKPSGYVKNNLDADGAISHSQAWLNFGGTGISNTNAASVCMTVSGLGTGYLGYISGGVVTVLKKGENSTDWAAAGSTFGASITELRMVASQSTDTCWALAGTGSSEQLYRYNPGSASWLNVGSAIGGTFGTLAIGTNDTLLTAYSTGTGASDKVKFAKWNKNGAWILNSANLSTKAGLAIGLGVDVKNDTAYVASYQSSSATTNCYKIAPNGTATSVTGFNGTTSTDSIFVAVDTTGKVYVLFRDVTGNSFKAKVKVKSPGSNTWTDAAGTTISDGAMSRGDIVVNRYTNKVYIAYADAGAASIVNRGFVLQYNGSNTFTKIDSSTNLARSVSLSSPAGIEYWAFKDGSNTENVTVKRNGPCRTWAGATSTTWATATNWYTGEVPGSSENIVIKSSATNAPAVPAGTSIPTLIVGTGSTMTINSGVVTVTGTLTVNGTTTGSGIIQLNGSSAQTITGTGTVNNLELFNSSGATIQSGSTITITGTYTPTTGVLTTNGGLLLKSDASGTARIAKQVNTPNYISGNVTVQRYNPGGRRAYRYFSHPFTSAIALSTITDNLDITGPGGSTNGFTNTSTNNPSAQWYDPTAGDPSQTIDPGWTYFTSASATTGNNSWKQYEGIKVLVRGVKGEGLTTTNYTPSAVTIDGAGGINQGTQVVTLTKGTNSGYNLVGNPFPSQIDLNLTTRGSNIADHFWVWDPNGGTKGAYIAAPLGIPFDSAFIIPAYSAFFLKVSANTNNTITFPESCKASSTAQSLFKSTAVTKPSIIELKIKDTSGITWDRVMLIIDSSSTQTKDSRDAEKFLNSEINFFTYGGGNDTLAIDTRPYVDGQKIPLCVWSFVKKDMYLDASRLKMPQGTYLFLDDSLTGTSTLLNEGDKYNFTITSDPATSGNRFKLRFYGNPTPPVKQTGIMSGSRLVTSLFPNPAITTATVKMEAIAEGQTTVRVYNTLGQEVYTKDYGVMQTGTLTIPVKQFAAGIYTVQVTCGSEMSGTQLVKQ
jgi:hypothetical protein